ncbi:MAG: penicillin-binding protein 2 [Elusimicrobia bacterium]|nr:penicillin-binding protein 2 [Elusimicrobiota bacterium]
MIERGISRDRLDILWLCVAAVGLVFFLRLVNLQILMHTYYRNIAEKNRTQILPQSAPRGRIYTRDSAAVAANKPSFSLIYFPGRLRSVDTMDKIAASLARRLSVPFEELRASLYKAVKKEAPMRLAENLSLKAMFSLSELKTLYEGIDIIVEARRYYPFGNYLSHLTGYISKMDAKEWAIYGKNKNYSMDSRVGKTGLEKKYEKNLKGKDGGIYLEVDARGKLNRILESRKWAPGADIYLTVDSKIQAAAEAGLKKSSTSRGAVVAIDPRSGAVLAIASMPDYDPNRFVSYSDEKTEDDFKELPEFNVAIQGTYPPGSIFKIVSAVAAFESGRLDPAEAFFCPGYYDAGSRVFKCWEKKGHGRMDFMQGLTHSCDVYFYNLGLKTGALNIEKYSRAFRLGMPTGIPLPDEKSGNVFGPSKRAARKSYWFIGDTLNLSIGQGELLVTPIQMAQMAAAVANGGVFWRPYYVERVVNSEGKDVFKGKPELLSKVVLKDSTWALIRDGLKQVVLEGTGRAAKINGVEVFGKTGTAQNPHGKDHAWFVAFARLPGEDSEIAVAVLVEYGEHGASSAAPIARDVIKAALRGKLPERREKSQGTGQRSEVRGQRSEVTAEDAGAEPPTAQSGLEELSVSTTAVLEEGR